MDGGERILTARNQPRIERIKDLKKYNVESNPVTYLMIGRDLMMNYINLIKVGMMSMKLGKEDGLLTTSDLCIKVDSVPHESRKIRFGDCEIISKNDKTACLIQIDENTKTGRRECSINSNTFLKLKSHLDKGIKLRNRQIEDINSRLKKGDKNIIDTYRKKIKEPIELLPRDKDDLVLMNPF